MDTCTTFAQSTFSRRKYDSKSPEKWFGAHFQPLVVTMRKPGSSKVCLQSGRTCQQRDHKVPTFELPALSGAATDCQSSPTSFRQSTRTPPHKSRHGHACFVQDLDICHFQELKGKRRISTMSLNHEHLRSGYAFIGCLGWCLSVKPVTFTERFNESHSHVKIRQLCFAALGPGPGCPD